MGQSCLTRPTTSVGGSRRGKSHFAHELTPRLRISVKMSCRGTAGRQHPDTTRCRRLVVARQIESQPDAESGTGIKHARPRKYYVSNGADTVRSGHLCLR